MIRVGCITSPLTLPVVPVAPASGSRAYTVDDMLALETLGAARFDPSGEVLLFERFGPFERQSDFGRQFVIGELRSKIHRADLKGDAAPQPLFEQHDGQGYTLGSLSPDGRYAGYLNASERGLAAGVARLDGSGVTPFDFSPGYLPPFEQPWIAGSLLPHEALPSGEVSLTAGLGREQVDALVTRWHQRNASSASTASRIGSGRFRSLSEPRGGLVLVDARDGRIRHLADGEFRGFFASADGSVLAALRRQRLLIDPDVRIEHGANLGGVQHELLVFGDVEGDAGTGPIEACPGCDVLAGSLNWSAKAPLLSFYARDADGDWANARYRVYDHRSAETHAVELDGIAPHVGRTSISMEVRSAWLGERLAVAASARKKDASVDGSRFDWYLLDGPTPRNLTAGFAGASPLLIAQWRESLILLHDGDAWRVDADGNRINLTGSIAEDVEEWRAPSFIARPARCNLQAVDTVVLQIAARDEADVARLLFVDPATGHIEALSAPTARSSFVAVAPAAGRAAVVDRSGNETVLMVVDAAGGQRELVRLNGHLRGVVGGTPVRIDHKGPDGSEWFSWMLLPPGLQTGDRVPTVVNVYPGAPCHETKTRWRLDDMNALNDHILAARGYAVLYPCLPEACHEVPRDPLDGLVENVFAAVDAAVERGHVDPERLAVQGHSYGGYATGALIGLTDRFKSAVAQAGIYDLISSYGQFDVRMRLAHERLGLDLFWASLMETSQGGMGAPPWDDPERYLRNSPLMHVRQVKTPILLFTGDIDYVSTTQTEEFFTALTRLNKDAVMIRYFGEDHVYNSPANIRDMWQRILDWYEETLGSPEARK